MSSRSIYPVSVHRVIKRKITRCLTRKVKSKGRQSTYKFCFSTNVKNKVSVPLFVFATFGFLLSALFVNLKKYDNIVLK